MPFRTLTGVWDLRDGTRVRDSEDKTLRVAGYLIRSSSAGDLRVMDALGNTLALPRHRDVVTDMMSGGSGEFVFTKWCRAFRNRSRTTPTTGMATISTCWV